MTARGGARFGSDARRRDSERIMRDDDSRIGDITVLLTCYRRPQNLALQVEALRNQTVAPKQIWLWINHHDDNRDLDLAGVAIDRVFRNDFNWKFFGRFAAALLADTEYVAVYDDDTIPGFRWHENCLRTMRTDEGILGTMGVILRGRPFTGFSPRTRVFCGWRTHNREITEVDFVGQGWFFKRDWLAHMWRERPVTWENGEDIHFSAMAKIHGGIPTYCPPHPADQPELHGSVHGFELGADSVATHMNVDSFGRERDECVRAALARGWRTVRSISL